LVLGGRRFGVFAELLFPPRGLAAVELVLELRHVDAQSAFAGLQFLGVLRLRALALLEPLLAHLELGLELRLAQVERVLALPKLPLLVLNRLLALRQPLLLALGS